MARHHHKSLILLIKLVAHGNIYEGGGLEGFFFSGEWGGALRGG